MTRAPSARLWALLALALGGLALLYAGPLRTRLLSDDYLLVEQARARTLVRSLTEAGPPGSEYRPLSRPIYFALLAPVAGGRSTVFHVVNAALFLAALALLADLLLALLPPAGALAGVLYLALLPLQRAILAWVSCSQDLLALVGVLAALALYRRGRRGPALVACAAAVASKESAIPVAAALVAWDRVIERRGLADSARRAWPFAVLSLGWAAVSLALRGPSAPPLRFDVSWFAAAYAHLAQSLLGIEHPRGWFAGLASTGPPFLPLLALAPMALAVKTAAPAGEEPSSAPPASDRARLGFAAVWLAAFGSVIGPVVDAWSSYDYALAAVGGALVVGTLMRRARTLGLLGLIVALLWVHAGTAASRALVLVQRPWIWTSHVSGASLQRAAALTDSMAAQLVRLEPDPPADARFFFATLPPFPGFQMGSGAWLRALYRKPGIESYVFAQFSDSTAGGHPCRFFDWNGTGIVPLYPPGADTFFQVGSELLLLDRVEGALHAFRRGAAAGEDAMDLLYWTGWAELWAGRRDLAERAWTRLGFRDDSLRWIAHLRAAHNTLTDGDTLEARRHLITGIQYGIGRPEAHAVLGELLLGPHLKYALLELKVATRLEPRDWVAHRDLALGLSRMGLDAAARRELDAMLRLRPALATDSIVVTLRRDLDRRAPHEVIEF